MNPSFCALTWTHHDFKDFDGIPSIVLGHKLQENSINMIMHVAGRNFKKEEALTVMNKIKDMGVKNILTLKGGLVLEPNDAKNEFPYGLEFLRFLKKEFGNYFNIATSGYPIGHPASPDPIKDLCYLKKKVDAGADFVMCQGVFDLKTFKDFYYRCRELEIRVPILPAVYAINSFEVLTNLKSFCKVMPDDYVKSMEKLSGDNDAITNYSVNYVSNLISALLKDTEISIPGVHIFCFNNFSVVNKIFDKLDFEDLKIWQP
ncbi:hypothetical protein Trydic_g22642 [Trypoxylus dichotomus]